MLSRREPKRVMLVVLTSDRGLAGAFNSNICKAAFNRWKQLEAEGSEVCFGIIGRKGRDYFTRRNANIRHDFLGVFEDLSADKAGEIGRYIVEDYTGLDLDACYLVYNEFKSAINQQVVIEPFLPIEPLELADDRLGDFIYEPSQVALLDTLLPMHVEVQIYRALARVGGVGARCSNDRHGRGDQQRERHDRPVDPPVQPGPPGCHHQGIDGDHRRR